MRARIKFNTTDQADDFTTEYCKYSLGTIGQSEWIVTLAGMDEKAKLFTHYYLSQLNKNKKRVDHMLYLIEI